VFGLEKCSGGVLVSLAESRRRTILSNEWYYPPFEADIPNYKILSQVDGLTGRMQPNYTYPLYFIPNYMYHNGCYGVQAYRDVDQQGPDRAYFGVFNCTMQEGMNAIYSMHGCCKASRSAPRTKGWVANLVMRCIA
jgi:hypothetical protein